MSSEPETIQDMQARANNILDAKYEPANIEAILGTMTHLSTTEVNQLRSLLYEFQDLMDGTLGDMTSDPIDIMHKHSMRGIVNAHKASHACMHTQYEPILFVNQVQC